MCVDRISGVDKVVKEEIFNRFIETLTRLFGLELPNRWLTQLTDEVGVRHGHDACC
jgi:hypothetical protein